MASNLSCIGLRVADLPALAALVEEVRDLAEIVGQVGEFQIRRWQDPSGARLVLGLRGHAVVDLMPSYAGAPGALLADCRMLNDETFAADVVDKAGEQVTAMTFELEQRRQLARINRPVSGSAAIVALGTDVDVYDQEEFETSPASLLDPLDDDADARRMAAESLISYSLFRPAHEATADARLAGVVLTTCEHTLDLTGDTFITARVRTAGFEADVCLDVEMLPELPKPGQVIAGTAFLVASMESIGFGNPTIDT